MHDIATRFALCFGAITLGAAASVLPAPPPKPHHDAFKRTFNVPRERLGPTANNPYFPLTPGLTLRYAGGRTTLLRTVLDGTETVDGMLTRVVEDREERNGRPVEISRDHYAADSATNDVFNFGEDVHNYRQGKPVLDSGSWRAGTGGATFGLAMPGHPTVGDRFYEELAPGVALDRAEVVATDETVVTPAGTFEHCVHLKETSELEPSEVSHTWFAPGVGMVKDGDLTLVAIQRPGA